jgi:membrane-anchored mycosin MYCP
MWRMRPTGLVLAGCLSGSMMLFVPPVPARGADSSPAATGSAPVATGPAPAAAQHRGPHHAALSGAAVRRPAAAPARTAACKPPQGSPASALAVEPWPQQRLDFTSAWPLTTGRGVTVAVVDSGVDAAHPQLAGHVESLDLTKTGTEDCLGHGTGVAGIIAGRDLRTRRIPFLGVAPGAELLSVKYTNEQNDSAGGDALAQGIRRAVDAGAKVINVSSVATDSSELRSAVEHAKDEDALIIASAGNVRDEEKGTEVPAYPANYPDVVSVGAVGEDGALKGFSNAQTRVSVTAPGDQVVSTWPGAAYSVDQGTSFSAPFVSGTAALIRAYRPELTAAQVKQRIEATADGGTATGTGGGMVNPFQAVTALLSDGGSGAGRPGGGVLRVPIDQPPPGDRWSRALGLAVAGGALGVAGLACAGAVIIPAGRRRRWRPGRRRARTADRASAFR